ncbi:MAG: PocR ligand-binding domain-containing protein [Anaerolineae bacterium]|jgi:excisionase family DNA binding protein
MNQDSSLLTTRQLQNLLQVDRITIYRMLRDGRLHGFKVGGQWRFSREAIEAWLQERQAGLEIPEAPPTGSQLEPSAQALPLSCIQPIQEVFAEALGVGAVTTDRDGRPIIPMANTCAFCSLILGSREGRKRCTSSWQAAAAVQGATPRPAVCHAGLSYIWGRIEVQGEFVAAIYAGQFLSHAPLPEAGWTQRLDELSQACGLRRQELEEALDSVVVLDTERQDQIPHMLRRVAKTFSEMGEERLSLLARLRRISEISTI